MATASGGRGANNNAPNKLGWDTNSKDPANSLLKYKNLVDLIRCHAISGAFVVAMTVVLIIFL